MQPPRQRQRRLRAEQLEQLKDDYLAGVPVSDLAERYGIARQTVIEHMRRLAVARGHPKLSIGEAARAADLYTARLSLAAVGTAFGVDAGTVRRVLAKAAVPIRDRPVEFDDRSSDQVDIR